MAERLTLNQDVGVSITPSPTNHPQCGAVAQLAERHVCNVDVAGSIPVSSTQAGRSVRFPSTNGAA